MDIGKKLKDLRIKNDLTLEEFESELRRILLPKSEKKQGLKERLLGGLKHEKK